MLMPNTDVPEPLDPDERRRATVEGAERAFGKNLRLERERQGLSQAHVAAALLPFGITWHQTTVAKVEGGTRPVGLREALSVSFVLGMPLMSLLGSGSIIAPADRQRVALSELARMERHIHSRRRELWVEAFLDTEDHEED